MYKRLKSSIDKYDILSKSQYHGFRENCSTQQALINIVEVTTCSPKSSELSIAIHRRTSV